jgi:lysozyme family protein
MTADLFTMDELDAALARVKAMDAGVDAKLAALDAVQALWDDAKQARLMAAQATLREGSLKFLDLMDRMTRRIEALAGAAGVLAADKAADARRTMGALHAAFHDREGLARTEPDAAETAAPQNDEALIPAAPEPLPLPAPPAVALETPTPLDSRRFEALADEYVRFYQGAGIRPTHAAKVDKLADRALAHRARYAAVGDPAGVPWWFLAAIHLLESTFNFEAHLHNGDPLTRRTFRAPAGQPADGAPPFAWEVSAADALRRQKLVGLKDWSLPRALWRWERYNGFGYRSRGVATPYLWSFSSVYLRGKFVRDGAFDGGATSAQCGAAVLLKALQARGAVTPTLDMTVEDEAALAPAVEATPADTRAIEDLDPAETHPFQIFFARRLSDLRHFTWRELLVKGGGGAELNDDPPQDLWPNVIATARLLEAIREKVGKPVRLHSVYRSPAYNRTLNGAASRSQHMAFTAADFSVAGVSTGDLAAIAHALRAGNSGFEGGVGVYNGFVHVDTRGARADWDRRG